MTLRQLTQRPCATLALALLVLFATGCQTGNYGGEEDLPSEAPTQQSAAGGKRAAVASEQADVVAAIPEATRVTMAFPTGERSTSAVLLEKEVPGEVILGQEFEYRIAVKNLTDGTLDAVRLTDSIPPGFNVTGTEPVADTVGASASWLLGALGPGASKSVTVRGKATEVGQITTFATVDYESSLRSSFAVVSPALELQLAAPAEGLSCDPFDLTVTVTNAGTGDARDVRVIDELPEGLTNLYGHRRLEIDFGTLASAQSKERTVKLKASRAGAFVHTATAESGGIKAEAIPVTTTLRQPVLALTLTGSEKAYAGRPVKAALTVTNNGDAVSEDTLIRVKLPSGFRAVSFSEGGTDSKNAVTWDLGEVAPGDSREFALELRGSSSGVMVTEARATGRCADEQIATLQTLVTGIPALVLQLDDESDLILVGEEVTYSIAVENQGSAADTAIVIACEFDDGIEVLGISGDALATVSGKTILFNTIPSLAPGERVELKVTVKSSKEQDSRFTVSLTSKQKVRPITENESTNFYN